jgi:hypothetical protein
MRCIFTTSNYCVTFYSTTLEVGRGYGVTPKSGVTYPAVRTSEYLSLEDTAA